MELVEAASRGVFEPIENTQFTGGSEGTKSSDESRKRIDIGLGLGYLLDIGTSPKLGQLDLEQFAQAARKHILRREEQCVHKIIADRDADCQYSSADKHHAAPVLGAPPSPTAVLILASGEAGKDADCQYSLTMSITFPLTFMLTVTNETTDMPIASDLRRRLARLLTGMLPVSTLFSLQCVLFLVLTIIDSVAVTMSLHPQYGRTKEEAQLASKTLSGRYTRSEQTFRGWHVRDKWSR